MAWEADGHRRPSRIAPDGTRVGYGRKYIGFGILIALSAHPPARSLYWSPTLATMS
jgi:hypothetical protein